MKTIKAKMLLLILLCVIIATMSVGFISIMQYQNAVTNDAKTIIHRSAQNASQTVNNTLCCIEQSVDTLAITAEGLLTDLQSFKTSDDYVTKFSETIKPFLENSALSTKGAITAYIRYNPDFTDPTSGLFLTRNSTSEAFASVTPTDFSIYDKTDLNHVGWYYIPVNNGSATWMEPYMNDNIGKYMISYVIPLFKDGVSIGIVGMDIDFTVFSDITNSELSFTTQEYYIVNSANQIIAHNTIPYGTELGTLGSGNAFTAFADAVSSGTETGKQFDISINGSRSFAYFETLENNMRLISVVKSAEIINSAYADISVPTLIAEVIICVIVGGVALYVINRITKPIKKLDAVAQKIAAGNLDVTIDIKSKDEIGKLANSFSMTTKQLSNYVGYINEISDILNQIAEGKLSFKLTREYAGEFEKVKNSLMNISNSLNITMTEIMNASMQVAQGSAEVANDAQALAESSADQSMSVEKLSVSIEKLTRTINEASESVKGSAIASEDAKSNIIGCKAEMQEMTRAIADIASASGKIGNTVKTVDEIASQTNILSINAAIEAARAGNSGSGFAVVASEIQDLAAKTAAATKDIASLIEDVIQKVKAGEENTNRANQALNGVVENSAIILSAVEEIGKANEEQVKEINSVEQDVRQISMAVQGNNSTAEKSAAVSEEMSSQAALLNERIGRFELK